MVCRQTFGQGSWLARKNGLGVVSPKPPKRQLSRSYALYLTIKHSSIALSIGTALRDHVCGLYLSKMPSTEGEKHTKQVVAGAHAILICQFAQCDVRTHRVCHAGSRGIDMSGRHGPDQDSAEPPPAGRGPAHRHGGLRGGSGHGRRCVYVCARACVQIVAGCRHAYAHMDRCSPTTRTRTHTQAHT